MDIVTPEGIPPGILNIPRGVMTSIRLSRYRPISELELVEAIWWSVIFHVYGYWNKLGYKWRRKTLLNHLLSLIYGYSVWFWPDVNTVIALVSDPVPVGVNLIHVEPTQQRFSSYIVPTQQRFSSDVEPSQQRFSSYVEPKQQRFRSYVEPTQQRFSSYVELTQQRFSSDVKPTQQRFTLYVEPTQQRFRSYVDPTQQGLVRSLNLHNIGLVRTLNLHNKVYLVRWT